MASLPYPPTPAGDQRDIYHGREIADPYRWLEDADAPETSAWIDAQNALTHEWLDGVAAREAIRERLTSLWDYPRAGAPWRRGRCWFQMRNSGLQNQDVLYVGANPDGNGARVLIDPNTFASDGTVALTAVAASDDGHLVAYATSEAGSDWLTWRVRDVDSGDDLPDEVRWSKFSTASWTPDGRGFFYARYDEPASGEAFEEANRGQRLCYHRLGTPAAHDVVVYDRPDRPEWIYLAEVTDDGRYLVVHVAQGTDPRNRVYYAEIAGIDLRPSARPDQLVALVDDFDAGYHLAGSDGTTLFLRTDADAPLGRIIAVDVERPDRDHWRELVAESEDTLERAKVVGGRLVTLYLHHATNRIRLFDLAGAPAGEVALPDLGTVDAITGRRDDQTVHYTFTSFTRPTSVYRHTIASGETTAIFQPEIDLDQGALVTEQVFVDRGSRVRVPMFLVHRRDVGPPPETSACQLGADTPALLWGYGGFNIPITPVFKACWLVWIERGGLLAVPNLRGGGEYGQAWHDAGRLDNKQNVFDDAIACAEWLVDHRWTRPAKLAIKGRSNGGLLAAACLTQRPDLFGAAVVEVGVLDMLRFHRFTIGWAWTSDYGSADDDAQFETLLAYSPLHNLKEGSRYPATLVTTGDHDDRVVPGHSFKFAAALQAAQGADEPVLIRVERSGGHGFGKPTSMLIAERADVLAFLTRALDAAP